MPRWLSANVFLTSVEDDMPRRSNKRCKDPPETEKIFRYWVTVLETKSGSVRNLPLMAIARVHIPRTKREPQRPIEDVLQLKDGTNTIEARNLDGLVAQLCERYPDGEYERRLHWERDREAELRRATSMNGLIKILANAVFREAMSQPKSGS
jgi:hypothetical protein